MAAGEFDRQGESALFAAVKGGHVGEGGAADLLLKAYPARPGSRCSPHHRIPFKSRHAGMTKRVKL
jgi:hypothetical protein